MSNGAAAVQIDAEGASVATTRLWRFRDQLRVTVIVKATFSLVHQGLMKIARPDPIFTADIHHGNNPLRTVRYSSDLAPYLPATDVLLTGHAYAPSGERATWVTAGIAILDGYEPVFEKYLDVRGDTDREGKIKPFQKMPLLYERAFGGPGWEDNPFGVGASGARGEPNVFYIGDHRRSAGFGPWSPHWPARRKLITNDVRRAIEAQVAEIPEGFDWSYYHAGPPDQRCAFLGGSEWVVLQGLRPDLRRVRTRLPAVKARALVFWAGEAPEEEPLELIADTLRVDPDRGVCSVTWRKSFAVADEVDLSHLCVLAGVEVGGQPIAWSLPGVARKSLPMASEALFPRRVGATTVSLSDADMEVISEQLAVDESGGADEEGPSRAALPPPVEAPPAPPPAERPNPMILGAFRLAVFSPDYEDDPDDPLLSTLVIRGRPSSVVPQKASSRNTPEPLKTTLVMQEKSVSTEPDIADDPSATTLVLGKKAPAPSPPAAPKVGLAGTLVIDDEDTEDTGLPPDLLDSGDH